jgi:hypothetical protein
MIRMLSLVFKENTVTAGEHSWSVDRLVWDGRLIGDRVILILDPLPGSVPARNVHAYSLSGQWLWTAEHPTDWPSDCYMNFVAGAGIVLNSFAGFTCRIDPETGRLIEVLLER